MLRHRLAWPLLMMNRVRRGLTARNYEPGTFRILLLHDVPPQQRAALDTLVAHVKRAHGVISPDEAEALLDGAGTRVETGRVPCLFTFDDGFVSNAEAARTVLDKHGVKALFFVCPGLIGEAFGSAQRTAIAEGIFQDRIGGADLAPDMRLMSLGEVDALRRAGHTIGAHGMRHRRLSTLDAVDLEKEVARSGQALGEYLGERIDWYAYAFGDIDSISGDALRQIAKGYRFCRSGVRGVNGPNTHPLAVRADSIDLAAPLAYSKFLIEGGLDGRYATARARLDALTS